MLNQSGRMPNGGTNPGTDGHSERLGDGVGSLGGGGAGRQGALGMVGDEIVGQGSGESDGVGSFGGDGVGMHAGSGRLGSEGRTGGATFCGAWPMPLWHCGLA
jgi:hypothetical protein